MANNRVDIIPSGSVTTTLSDVHQAIRVVNSSDQNVEAVITQPAAPVVVINDISNRLSVVEGARPYGVSDQLTAVIQEGSPNRVLTVTQTDVSVVVVVGTGGGGLRYAPPIPISDVSLLQANLDAIYTSLSNIQQDVAIERNEERGNGAWGFDAFSLVEPPGVGGIRFNANLPGDTTEIYVSDFDANGSDRKTWVERWSGLLFFTTKWDYQVGGAWGQNANTSFFEIESVHPSVDCTRLGVSYITGSGHAHAHVLIPTITPNPSGSSSTTVSASYAATASLLLGSVESASYALSSSYAETASYFEGSIESASYALTASYFNGLVTSASYAASSSYALSSSNAQTASYYGGNVLSASYALSSSNALSASYYSGATTSASYALSSSMAQTASSAVSSSYAETASYVISSSYSVTSSLSVSSSYAITASYLLGAVASTNTQTIGARVVTEDVFIVGGSKGYRHIGYPATIEKVRLLGNTLGSASVHFIRSGVTLGSASLNGPSSSIDTTLSGWTTTLNTDDLVEFYVSGSTTYITDLYIFIDIQST